MNNNLIKHREGFTLVEVIISIAVLGLVCAVVLKLFVLSNEVAEQSRVEDVASIHATNAIEVCKQAHQLDDIKSHPFFYKATLNSDEEYNLSGVILYDNDWKILSVDTAAKATQTAYKLKFNLTQNNNSSNKDGTLMDILITINKVDKKTITEHLILEYSTSKYFVFEE